MAAGLVGGLVGGGMGMASGAASGLANYAMTQEARDWAEKMRRTAYQTEVVDMTKAGLNPMLAYSAKPEGTTNVPPAHVDFGDIGSGFQQGVSTAQQMRMMQPTLDRARADAGKALSEASIADQTAGRTADVIGSQIAVNQAQSDLIRQQTRESSAREIATDVNRFLSEAELPAARARQAFNSSEFGESMTKFHEMMQKVIPSFGAFSSGAR